MTDLKEFAERRSALLHIDPRKLKVKAGLNARTMDSLETREHIEWLSASIAETGVRHPLEVFTEGEDVFVAHGHCRLEATLLAISRGADIKTVPCIPEPRGTNEIDRMLNQNVDNAGKPLTPLEAGANIKRAHALGWSVSDIARKLGKSVSYVSQALDFQSAPQEVHEAVKAGEISATLAAQTVREFGPVKATAVVAEAVKEAKAEGRKKATARNLSGVKGLKPKPPKQDRPDDDIEIKKYPQGELFVRFGEKIIVLPHGTWEKICAAILAAVERRKFA